MDDPKIMATAALAAIFVALAALETLRPVRAAQRVRWPLNLGLGALSLLIGRLSGILGPLAAATWAQRQGLGLLNIIAAPNWLAIPGVIIAMDFAIYWQHRAMHSIPWGWALHRLHHADTGFDVTTGVRFNPGEALASMLYKALIVLMLGAGPPIVIVFETYLALFSLFEHANLRLPVALDTALRRFWVTPAVHSIHHSAHGQDHDHNFGFAIGLWDHIFGTYQNCASGANIGLPQSDARD